MRLIAKTNLLQAAKSIGNADLTKRTESWLDVITHNDFPTFHALNVRFPKADLVGNRIVFNLGSYRLIVGYNFQTQTLYFKHLLTHAEYDRKDWQQ